MTDGRLPIGSRFTSPFFGDCEITGYVEQTPEQFMRDEPKLPFDYIVRCGPKRAKKLMTAEFVLDIMEAAPVSETPEKPNDDPICLSLGRSLTDDEICDIAVASGWIEDTLEARDAYLAAAE